MKKLMFLIAAIMLISACKKDSQVSTGIEITVKTFSTSTQGAIVKLYASYNDYIMETNEIASKLTDANGKVVFSDLISKDYYWTVQSGCFLGMDDNELSTTIPLTENQVTKFTVNLTQGSKFLVTNTTNDDYILSVNGTVAATIPAHASNMPFAGPIGVYSLTFQQSNGNKVLTGTANVNCDNIPAFTIN